MVFETTAYAIPPLQQDLYIYIVAGVNPMVFEAAVRLPAGRHVLPPLRRIFYLSPSVLNHLSISSGKGKTMMDDFSVEISISVCR